ncbi:MAG TPA: hypothetical protein PKD78_09350, partial [Saprospiraceae bacterium]|nr:hypothetical protein [Saprospiraceae bacterium]
PAGTAHSAQVRRDRYLPGDTLRLDYVAVVDSGRYDTLYRYVYHEVVRSDIGGGSGNDAFEVKNAQGYFIQKDRIRYLRSRLEVHYADGTSASCEVPEYVGAWNERLYKLGVPNTQPPSILDEVVTIRHTLRSSFSVLHAQGLLPSPKLEKGDTVRIYTDFVMATNFTPFSSNQPDPPLIGFRTAMSHNLQRYIWNKAPARRGQYSGFKETRSTNQYSIRPCDLSSVVKPFQYRMRIARQNMFPYEVRPLARIAGYHQSTPAGLELASAQLQYLVLQDSVERLKNFPLSTTPKGAWAEVDFQKAFADPVDEGFSLALQTNFQPNCYFDLPDTSRQAVLTQYAPGLKEKNTQADTLTNKLGFFSNNPALRLETADTVVYSPQVNFDVDFTLRNWVVPPAPNLWVAVVSPSGMASDFKLVLLPSGQPLVDINGIYRLNTLQGFSTRQLRLLGRNVNCAPDSLLIIYGWGCAPLNGLDDSGCWRDTFAIELRLQNAELELDVKKEPPFIRLCEASDYYEVEVYNAKIGYAYDPIAQVKLPPGLDIVPGSCQISYPLGSSFVNIPDPQPLPGNVYHWKIGAVQPAIGANGLPGVDLPPYNALRIRFRTVAECGFVSNAQPLYGADATDPCGRSTNVLNKPGKPLNIFGLNPTYGVQMNLKQVGTNTVFCGGEARYEVEMNLLGQPSPGDSVYVLLPSGVTLKADSYKSLLNAPNTAPTPIPGGFRVALPTNMGGGIGVKFQFDALLSQSAGCIDQTIVVQTRVRSTSLCVSTGQPCAVYVSTGEAFLKIEPLRPE